MPTITRIYALGSNGSGQLGLGHYEDISKPERGKFRRPDGIITTQISDRITKIVAGGNHTLALTESGLVYLTGDISDGQCEVANSSHKNPIWTHFEFPEDVALVTDIAATWSASYAVVNNDKIYRFGEVCGRHELDRVGREEAINRVIQFTNPIFDVASIVWETKAPTIRSISASMGHVVIVLSNGSLFGWGNCRKGQLGEDRQDIRVLEDPSKISVSFAVARAVTGRDFTYVFGTNGQSKLLGRLQNSDCLPSFAETPIGFLSSGWSSIFNLYDNRICGCGRDDRGQLPPTCCPAIQFHAAGSEHSVALTTAGNLIAWGWGEHGNCGEPLDGRGNVIGRSNAIDLVLDHAGEDVAGVGAGCASSFIWTVRTT